MVLAQLDSHMQKNETRPLSYTIPKINVFKTWKKTWSHKTPRIKHKCKVLDTGVDNDLFGFNTIRKKKGIKAKINKCISIKQKCSAQWKQPSTKQKATYGIGENISKSCIC